MARNNFDQSVRRPGGDNRSQNHRPHPAGAGDKKGHSNARQNAVTHGVTHQRHATQDEEVADQPTSCSNQEGHQSHETMTAQLRGPRFNENTVKLEFGN